MMRSEGVLVAVSRTAKNEMTKVLGSLVELMINTLNYDLMEYT